jgi:hypothetical protein
MTSLQQAILQNARVAELRANAKEVATLCKSPPAVELPRSPTDRRRLLALLARERRRNVRLVALLKD